MSAEQQGISMEEFMDELIASEDETENADDTSTPVEETETEATKNEADETDTEEDVDDDYLADVDEDEADDPKDDSEEDDDSEEEEKGEVGLDTEFTFKADGEDVTVDVKEMQKSYGLQKTLTRKGQDLAEKEKLLEREAEVVAYAKETPERKELLEDIDLMSKALDRGYALNADGTPHRGQDGNIVYLTAEQMKQGPTAIAEAQEKLGQLAQQPLQSEVLEAIPELYTGDRAVQDKAVQKYGDYLTSIGYSKSMISTVSPAELLLAKRALEGDELAARVKASKARKAGKAKPAVVSNPTKAAKGTPSSSKRGKSKVSAENDAKMAAQANNGEISYSDLFMDLD